MDPSLRAAARRARERLARISLAARFALASAVILLTGALTLGTWIAREIETSVIRRVAADSALYVEALVEPELQALASRSFGDEQRARLHRTFEQAALAGGIVSIKIWSAAGEIVYATDPGLVGTRPRSSGLGEALKGTVVSRRTELRDEEHAFERRFGAGLIETYIPIRLEASDRVIAVAEFYQPPDLLEAELDRARRSTWLIIAAATLAMYLLLAGMVRAGSNTIESQRAALEAAVAELSAATQRLREVSAARVETDEAVLRRVATEIHDGLAQDLAAALVTLGGSGQAPSPRQAIARAAVESALREVRTLARGLALPDLEPLSLGDVLERACTDHERKTGHRVERRIDAATPAPMPVKISAYRVLEEALSNTFRHVPGARVTVRGEVHEDRLIIECADDGSGLPSSPVAGLGMRGMRERVELLGGHFEVASRDGHGTVIRATVPL